MDTPPHLRERVFRTYELAIGEAVKNYPNETRFCPRHISATTFVARLRDAIRSYEVYEWQTSKIDYRKFIEVRKDLIILQDGRDIFVKSRLEQFTTKRQKKVDCFILGSTHSNFWLELHEPKKLVIEAIATLLSERVVNKPVKITGCGIDSLYYLTSKFDIQLIPESDHIILL